jgi:hypothetical protein
MLWPSGASVKSVEQPCTPDDPVLLCKGKPIAYLIVWKSEKTGNEADPYSGTFLGAEDHRRLA